MIRQDQIRQRAGFVDERSEADDERHALQRVGDLPRRRRSQTPDSHRRSAAPSARRVAGSRSRRSRRDRCALRNERQAARLVQRVGGAIQRVDRLRVEQTVGVRERRAADDRHRRTRSRRTRARAARSSPPARRSSPRPSRRVVAAPAALLSISAAIASASSPSVPGLQATNSSALAAVCDRRASTCTNFGRTPVPTWRMRP